jgi:sortase A
VVGGILFMAYGAAIYFWRDPVTDVYARWKQHQLAGDLDRAFEEFQVQAPPAPPSTETAADQDALARYVRLAASKFQANLEVGQPLGRIEIPKLDIDPVFVHGTRWAQDLSRGPGHYLETSLPGLGRTTAIAGHRTTFGAPFRHIDDLEPGDEVILFLAYGTFHYEVVGHEIVDDDDWSIIRKRGYEALVLSACHPLFSASQRWIVYARLTEVKTRGGSYTLEKDSRPRTSRASDAPGISA